MNDITIVEVGPRDGLQNESVSISLGDKQAFIQALIAAGLGVIEAGSFVSPKAVPSMGDTDRLLASLPLEGPCRFPVLVPNAKGLERALAAGAKEVAVFAAASETFSQKNIRASMSESLERYTAVIKEAKAANCRVRGYISCIFGCPYEGKIARSAVIKVAEQLLAAGCDEISLGDTIGVGTPNQVCNLLADLTPSIPVNILALHCHDTYGQALANIYAGLNAGVVIFDSATAGLGGCPYAKGATGNLATEELVYCLDGLGLSSGVNLEKLVDAGEIIGKALGRNSRSKVACALLAKRQK